MPRYKVIESIGGAEDKIITAKTPMNAIIKYLKGEVVNLTTGRWNWDFEVILLRGRKRSKQNG
jgi:hypothetical protein